MPAIDGRLAKVRGAANNGRHTVDIYSQNRAATVSFTILPRKAATTLVLLFFSYCIHSIDCMTEVKHPPSACG